MFINQRLGTILVSFLLVNAINIEKIIAVAMTQGVLGIIICPMFDDNLTYMMEKDAEKKNVTVVDNDYNGSLLKKLDKIGQPYDLIKWDDIFCNRYEPKEGEFNILILAINLGLHSKPKELKEKVEEYSKVMAPHVDGFGFYFGTCGNYAWDIPAWSIGTLNKPGAMFCDSQGNLCDDCVGAAIAGGPRYLQMQKKYPGHFYLFPAMATNFDDFMDADQADNAAIQETLTDEMRETLGIEPGRDGYLRWLLRMGDYKNILKIQTGLGNKEEYDEKSLMVAERTQLNIIDAEDGWGTLQPTEDIYTKSKSFLKQ